MEGYGGKVEGRATRLLELKHQVYNGLGAFQAISAALREIRDRGLYKVDGHKSFRAFCALEFGLGWRTVRRYVSGAEVIEDVWDCETAPPLREIQTRELGRLKEAGPRAEAWCKAVKKSADGQPTSAVVRAEVDEELRRGAAPTKPNVAPPPAPAKLRLADGKSTQLKYREGDAFSPRSAGRVLGRVRKTCALEGVGAKATAKLQREASGLMGVVNGRLRGKAPSGRLAAVVLAAMCEGLSEEEEEEEVA